VGLLHTPPGKRAERSGDEERDADKLEIGGDEKAARAISSLWYQCQKACWNNRHPGTHSGSQNPMPGWSHGPTNRQGQDGKSQTAGYSQQHSEKATDKCAPSQRTGDFSSATTRVERDFDQEGDENAHGDPKSNHPGNHTPHEEPEEPESIHGVSSITVQGERVTWSTAEAMTTKNHNPLAQLANASTIAVFPPMSACSRFLREYG
jgi:hypothetical protein